MNFTVLMPVYGKDNPELFREAVDSVINSHVKPSQFVIVVDGPVDSEILSVIDTVPKELLTLVKLETNQGIVKALNEGLMYCRYEYVARCDADDVNFPERFGLQLKEFQLNPNLALCGGQIIENSDNRLAKRAVPCELQDIKRYLRFRCPFNHMTVMYKKSIVLSVGGYPDIKYREDYALWAIMISSGFEVSNLEEVLVLANTGRGMYGRRGGIKQLANEYEMQKLLLKLGINGFPKFLLFLFIRSINTVIGSSLRSLLYLNLLRENVNLK